MEDIIYEYEHDRDPNFIVSTNANNRVPKHFHKCIEILYITQGELLTTVNDESFIADKDDIVFIRNYCVHSFATDSTYEKFLLIVPSNYSGSVNKILQNSTLPAKLSDKEFNRKLLPIIKNLYDECSTMPALVKKGYYNVLMGYLFDHYPLSPVKTNGSIDFIVDVLQYINAHYTEELTLDSLSSNFGYNKYYFSRLFNTYVGESLSNYINIVRAQHFMKIARDMESLSISSLAHQCGFDSLTTFYRCFKKLYGATPKAYFAQKA